MPITKEPLPQRLRKLAPGAVEWHVADPDTGAYCLSGSEAECTGWLDEHKAKFPNSIHANKVVKRVHIFDDLEKAALEAAEFIEQSTAKGEAGVVQAVPVAWRTDSDQWDFNTTQDTEVRDRWIKFGNNVTPLYAGPPQIPMEKPLADPRSVGTTDMPGDAS